MRFVRSALLLAIVLALAATPFLPGASAQDDATPTAATPAIDDPLAGRLGGSLQGVIDTYGEPDFTDDGLIRYDALDLNGLSTILVVYHDEDDLVTRMALVYPFQPDTLTTSGDVLALAANVGPADGICQPDAVETTLGPEVYPCHSVALMTVFDAAAMEALDARGGLGDYSVAVDPLFDDYFEILVVPGSDGTQLDPGLITTDESAAPVATPTLAEQYPVLEEPTMLMNGDVSLGDPLSFTGEIKTLQIAEFGTQFRLGEDESLGVSSLFQVAVPIADSTDVEVLFVGFNGDATELAIGDTVTVYGSNYGTQCFDNALDEEICQPLIAADLVEE
ncbi:MAG: hypothetical protein E6R14_11795 [Thermomicrobiales bacterium]|nr:MAG: hypothetical protein E6R14_11795 [Thermomicrobiales bacterium]